jgi:hypothetical protein
MEENTLISWLDNAEAIDALIARANRTLDFVDQDLSLQNWETLARAEALRAAMHDRNVHVRIILNSTRALSQHYPRLANLLKSHGHRLAILQTACQPKPEQFMAVADGQHCLFRPVLVQSHGFSYFDNPAKSNIYDSKVKVIWQKGGRRLFPEAFGL